MFTLENRDFDKLLDMAQAVIDTDIGVVEGAILVDRNVVIAAEAFVEMVAYAKENDEPNVILRDEEVEFLSKVFGG